MKAVVILYSGTNLNAAERASIRAIVNAHCDGQYTNIDITQLSDADLISAAAVHSNNGHGMKTVEGIVVPTERTEADEAVIFIGKYYENLINLDMHDFEYALTRDYLKAQRTPTKTTHQKALINAMSVLGQKVISISENLMQKYNFSEETLKKVKRIYKDFTI